MNIYAIAAATALAVASAHAYAHAEELEIIGEHGAWRTAVTISEDGTLVCSAGTRTITGGHQAAFAITVDQYGLYRAVLIVPEIDAIPGGDVEMMVGAQWWTLEQPDVHGVPSVSGAMFVLAFGFDPAQREFVADVMAGDVVVVLDESFNPVVAFSLTGSAAAIRQMDECRSLIEQRA